MSEDRPDPRRALERRHVKPWRLAFVVAAVALTVLTHWPRLQLAPQVPASDKMIHLVAFAIVTVLLWRTRWIRSLRKVAIVVLLWSVVDELTQGLPGLNRWVSGYDAAANALGVIVAAAFIRALEPFGGPRNRPRLALQSFAFDELFAEWRTWLLFALVVLACAIPVAVAWPYFQASLLKRFIALAAIAWLLVTLSILARVWRHSMRTTALKRPCFACGSAVPSAVFGDSISAECPACAERLVRWQWEIARSPVPPRQAVLLLPPILFGIGSIALFNAAILAASSLYAVAISSDATSRVMPALAQIVNDIPPTFARTVDLALCLIVGAGATLYYRRRLANEHDRGSFVCRRCGHDLSRTPTVAGEGRCGECGEVFYREEERA